jgi:oligogalacturonide lyase
VPVLLLLAGLAGAGHAQAPAAPTSAPRRYVFPEPRDPSLPSIFYIGDSTVRNSDGTARDGLLGWGDATGPYFDTLRVNVVNRARGGRSSRTYLTEGLWDATLALVKRGDVVLIQFGHNDGGAINDTSRARGSIKGVGEDSVEIDNLLTHRHEVVHSYGWYLRRYVADTRAKGATPILVTPVPRNIWKDGAVVRDRASYAGWAAQVARDARVPLLDLNELVAHRYDLLGPERVKEFFPGDHTHTNRAGAQLTARVAVEALAALPGDPVGAYLTDAAHPLSLARDTLPDHLPRLESGGGPMPLEWVDRDTGHRVVRLSRREGINSSFYFHNNPFVPGRAGEADQMVYYGSTPDGRQLFALDLETLESRQVTHRPGGVSGEIVDPRRREAVYQAGDSVFATSIDDGSTRLLYVFPAGYDARISTLNADGTLLAGAKAGPIVAEILRKYPSKSEFFDRIFQAHPPYDLFVVDLRKGGAPKVVHHENTWLGHVQFSPTDPNLLMFCHEGPWHLVDRIWTIDVRGGSPPKLMHRRTVDREIAGHEFFSPDGKTIWYDLQVPRGETFYLAGTDVETGRTTRYRLERDEWSIHFTQSPDGRLFAGDGGDSTQVAHAKDGRWIYLFRPEGDHFVSERLVDMSHHGYRPLEPNVHFSPDGRWVIFRSDLEGQTEVYAVEVARAEAE